MVGWEAGALGSSSASALGGLRHVPLLFSGPGFPHLQNGRWRDQLFSRPGLRHRFAPPLLCHTQILGQPSPEWPPCPAFPSSRVPRPMKGSSVRRWAGPPAWNRTGSCCPEALTARGQASSVPPTSPPNPRATLCVCLWGEGLESQQPLSHLPGTAHSGKQCP